MSYFPRTSAEINAAELRQAPKSNYDQIKAKIDRGFNRVTEGDDEVVNGLAEMVATQAFTKHYKTIEAFVEGEYGKSRSWYYKIMRGRFSGNQEVTESNVEKVHKVTDSHDKKEEAALKKVEAARTTQGPDSEGGPPVPRVRTEAGKPKRDLSIWKEIEERLLGVAANRVDTLNHECPNPVFHKKLQDQLSACFQTLAMWRESVK